MLFLSHPVFLKGRLKAKAKENCASRKPPIAEIICLRLLRYHFFAILFLAHKETALVAILLHKSSVIGLNIIANIQRYENIPSKFAYFAIDSIEHTGFAENL